jgi:uncharacterized protein
MVVQAAAARVEFIAGKGRGMVAARRITAGEILERAPVLVLPPKEARLIVDGCNVLSSYVFAWEDSVAIALGHGSLYNHSYRPNVRHRRLLSEELLEFSALTDIEPGTELCINYRGETEEEEPVWFNVR